MQAKRNIFGITESVVGVLKCVYTVCWNVCEDQ